VVRFNKNARSGNRLIPDPRFLIPETDA